MSRWKRPLLSNGSLQPTGRPHKRPRLAGCLNSPALTADCLSKTFDLSLRVYVSGFFLQDMLCYYTHNLVPLVSKHGLLLESLGREKVTRITTTFLQCEWGKGTIPLLRTNVSLTTTTAVDAPKSGAWNRSHSPSKTRHKTTRGRTSRKADGNRDKSRNTVSSSSTQRHAEGSGVNSKHKNQFPDVIKRVKSSEKCVVKDQGTQTSTQPTVKIKRREQSVQTNLSSELRDGKHLGSDVLFKDCSVQTAATPIPHADRLLPPQTPSRDNPDQKDTQAEEVAVKTLGDRPMKRQHTAKTVRTRAQEQPDSSPQTSNNLVQLAKIQAEDEQVQKELHTSDPMPAVADNCFPVEDLGQGQTQEGTMDKPSAGETTQSGNMVSTGNAAQSGNAPSEDAAQHVEDTHSGENTPSRTASGHVQDLDLRKECSPRIRAQNLHRISALIQNSENDAETVGAQPANNPPPFNVQCIPQFEIQLPGNVRYGLNLYPNPCFQTLAMNTILPTNGPCHSTIPTWPMPQSSSLNWATEQQFPPQTLAIDQQGTNNLSAKENDNGQGTGLQQQVPSTHTNPVQTVIRQSVRTDRIRNNPGQSCRNLIQLTEKQFNEAAAKRTESQVWTNPFSVKPDEARSATVGGPCYGPDPAGYSTTADVPSVGTDWKKSPDQGSVATMGNLDPRGLRMPVTLSGNCNKTKPVPQISNLDTTGFQSSSFAVNMLPCSEESGKGLSSLVQKPMADSVVPFSDTKSALAQCYVLQRQVTATESKDFTPGLHGNVSAAQGMDQAQYCVSVESVKQAEVNTAMQMNYGMVGVTDKLTPSDQTSTNICGSKSALKGNPAPKQDSISWSLSEQPQPSDGLKQVHHEQMDTVFRQSLRSVQKPTSAGCYNTHMPSLDEIPLPDERPLGKLLHDHTGSKNELPNEQTSVENDVRGSSLEPEKSASDTNQILHEQKDTVCKSASAQQKTSNTQRFSGRIPSLDDIPLPDKKVQNSFADNAGTGEVFQPSDEQETKTLTPVTPRQSHAREEAPTCENRPPEKAQLETIVNQIQMIVGQLTEAQVSPKVSPPQGNASPGTNQSQKDISVGRSPEQTSSKGLCSSLQDETSSALPSADSSSKMCSLQKASLKRPGSLRFMPYGVKSKKRTAERSAHSARNKDTNTVIEALIMHEIPKLMRSHSNLSTEAIQEQCSRLRTRYSSKSLQKGEKMSQGTETDPVRMKNSWTLTSRPQRVNRRLMTDTIHVRESSTITNIIGRREMTTLTDNCWRKDAWTLARRFKPAISRSCQTGVPGVAEVGTMMEPVPRPVATEQGKVPDSTEHNKTTLLTALTTTHHTTSHLTAGPLMSCQTSRLGALEQSKALVQKVSECVSEESADDKVEDLGDISQQPPGDDGMVRITIKVKIGKGSNIRLAS